jgi:hypothetical protein
MGRVATMITAELGRGSAPISSVYEWHEPARRKAIDDILRLVRVPTDRCSLIGSGIDKAVEWAMAQHHIHRVRNLKPGLKSGPDRRKRLRRIARLIVEHAKEARNEMLDAYVDACASFADHEIRSVGFKNSTWVQSIEIEGKSDLDFELGILREAEAAAQFLGPRPKKTESHRPLGSIKNPALRSLILDLHRVIVEEGHMKLTLRKDADGEIGGTMPAVLDILRPFLSDIIPVRLPYKTLRDLRNLARGRERRGRDDLVSLKI